MKKTSYIFLLALSFINFSKILSSSPNSERFLGLHNFYPNNTIQLYISSPKGYIECVIPPKGHVDIPFSKKQKAIHICHKLDNGNFGILTSFNTQNFRHNPYLVFCPKESEEKFNPELLAVPTDHQDNIMNLYPHIIGKQGLIDPVHTMNPYFAKYFLVSAG